jgi:DNA processing protein
MPNPEEQIYANALNLIPQVGPVSLARLLEFFGSFKIAFQAKRSDYVAAGLNPKLVEQIVTKKANIDPPLAYAQLAKLGIDTILINSSEYPDSLKEISAAPPILYIRGQASVLQSPMIAVVGTRKITEYGKMAAAEIVAGLVNAGLTVVSGLAFGIDAEALKTSVDLDSRSVGVLASAIDDNSISPKANFQLAHRILQKGCVISEHGLGADVGKSNFPVRNRIISGLSIGTVVIEADVDSGSLITANYALEQNREVFAVPGSIFSDVSRGTNNLIKKGAKLVTNHIDILEELNLDLVATEEFQTNEATTPEEQQIIESLSRDPIHIDDLVRALGLPAAEVNSTLLVLEMKGRVRNLGGAKFAKIR